MFMPDPIQMCVCMYTRCVFVQVLIASIMCGYSEEDWTELAQMSEVTYLLLIYMVMIVFFV